MKVSPLQNIIAKQEGKVKKKIVPFFNAIFKLICVHIWGRVFVISSNNHSSFLTILDY